MDQVTKVARPMGGERAMAATFGDYHQVVRRTSISLRKSLLRVLSWHNMNSINDPQ